MPPHDLEADILEYAHRLEAELFMKGHTASFGKEMPARALTNPWMRRIPSNDV
jgi:hypothetical protein